VDNCLLTHGMSLVRTTAGEDNCCLVNKKQNEKNIVLKFIIFIKNVSHLTPVNEM
jgi:hypothetical protein